MNYIYKRRYTLGAIIVIVPLGFATKLYTGPASGWVNNSLGGILYVIFWCLFFSFIFPNTRGWKIGAAVFAATSLIEVLQLWHPPLLEAIRSTFIGVTLLGNSFSLSDLVYYLAGALLAWGLIELLRRYDPSP